MADDESDRHRLTLGDLGAAGLSTGAAWLQHVAQEASRYVERSRETVTAGARGEKSYGETAADLWDGYEAYVRRLIQLPPIYVLRFFKELQDTRRTPSG